MPESKRFEIPSSIAVLHKELPIQYMIKEPGHNYQINKVGMGLGNKIDPLKAAAKCGPAPNQYEVSKT